jgi:hypothetical protein
VNENSLKILESFGFEKANLKEGDYYCLSQEVTISHLKAIYVEYTSAVDKYY